MSEQRNLMTNAGLIAEARLRYELGEPGGEMFGTLADALEKAEAKAAAWDELRSEVTYMTGADVGRSRIVYASEMDERLAKHQSGESK